MMVSIDEFIENNEGLFEHWKLEKDNKVGQIAVGSFLNGVFEDERLIPLFFKFLGEQFDKDYAEECEWVRETFAKGENGLETLLEEHPLGLLAVLMKYAMEREDG